VGECPAGGALLWTVTIRLNLSCWRLIQQAVSVYAGGPYCQRTDTEEGVEKELTVLNRGKLRGLPWVKLGSS
jgi:hypothetical protein